MWSGMAWAGSDVLLAYVDARITALHPHLTRGLFCFSRASSVSSEPLVRDALQPPDTVQRGDMGGRDTSSTAV